MAQNKRIRFNVIDILIIILIIGAIGGIVLRYNIVGKLVTDSNRDEVRITVLVSGIEPECANSIRDNEEYYIEDKVFGTLVEHSDTNKNALVYKEAEDGSYIEAEDPARKDVTVVITAKGVIDKDGSFKLGGSRFLAAGKVIDIQSKSVNLKGGVIISIEKTKTVD